MVRGPAFTLGMLMAATLRVTTAPPGVPEQGITLFATGPERLRQAR